MADPKDEKPDVSPAAAAAPPPKGDKPKGEGKPKAEGKSDKGGDKAKKGKGGDKGPSALPVDETPDSGPRVPPRLREHYRGTVRARLTQQFGLQNPHQVPRLLKIVLNVGAGAAVKNPKMLDAVVVELSAIAGQRPVITRAKKAISNFSLRQGLPIGASVTLRGARMYEFLDRFINVTVPRFRDFRGLPTRSFDGRGNYTIGIKEQMVFPEIDYDKVETIHGMDITFVTSAGRDDVAMALLREMGMPFRGETPVLV